MPLLGLKIRLAFGVALLTLLIFGSISYRQVKISAESARWVRHSHEVVESIQILRFGMEHLDSNCRTFLWGGHDAALQSCQTNLREVVQDDAAVRRLTEDNPVQQRQLTRLEAVMAQQISSTQAAIDLRRLSASPPKDHLRSEQRRELMRQYQILIDQLQAEESRLLVVRDADTKRRLSQTKILLIGGTLLGLFVALIAVWSADRDSSARGTAEESLLSESKASEARYRGLLEAAPDAMIVVDQEGEIVLLNVQAEKQFGYSRDELVGHRIDELVPEGFAERLIADALRSDEDARAQEIGSGIELFGRRKDKTEFPIEIMLSPLKSVDGILVTAAIRDITKRKKAEEALFLERGLAQVTLNCIGDAIASTDTSGKVIFMNFAAEAMTGWSMGDAIGKPIEHIFSTVDCASHRPIRQTVHQGDGDNRIPYLPENCTLVRRDGSEIPIEHSVAALHGSDGRATGSVIVFRDVSASREMALQIAYAAEHDFLTGLPNRLLLNDRIGQAISLASRNNTRVAVMFLDLDGFKHINDSLGHPIGDKLLQLVAKRLVGCVRASDTVSRQGGDEFVILLSEVVHPEDSMAAARRMLESVAKVCSIDRSDLHVTTSIGVSVYPEDGLTAEALIKNADTAMYQAKDSGRQGYRFFEPAMNTKAVERQTIEEGLRRALQNKEFTLNYQPKVDLMTGEITGAEALIRWTHPLWGPMSPAQFIPIAEACGLILPIGRWVLREACSQARAWTDAGLAPITMAVNISALDFRDEHFLENVFTTLAETGWEPTRLELELTESVLMKRADAAESMLKALRARGVKLAVDDFGTGYSSLSYLRNFSIDTLKIDQSFIRQLTLTPDETTIVASMIGMGRSLKLRIVAEGVESLDELRFLQAHQCDEAQGYYFSRPVPAQQFAVLLGAGAFDMSKSSALNAETCNVQDGVKIKV